MGWDTGIYRVETREAANQIMWTYISLLFTPTTECTQTKQNKITHFKSNISNGDMERPCYKLADCYYAFSY